MKERDMHPGAPRDVDLAEFLRGVGFHPANTERKQLGHEAARLSVAAFAHRLHLLLPPGRDKAMAFTALEDLLMRANRALALGGGPREDGLSDVDLQEVVDNARSVLGDAVYEDSRIQEYKAEQVAAKKPDFSDRPPLKSEGPRTVRGLTILPDKVGKVGKVGKVTVAVPGAVADLTWRDRDAVEEVAASLLSAANEAFGA
jgi:hypothetical protein